MGPVPKTRDPPAYHPLVPVSLTNLFRALVVLLMAVHVFAMYCLARTLEPETGFRIGVAIVGGLFSLAMLIPLLPAVGLPELPELLRWRVSLRRWRTGRCPGCGYPTRGLEDPDCPECGTALEEPAGYRFGAAAIRRFALMLVAAWIIGIAAAETWTLADERDFAREAAQWRDRGATGPYQRARRWPSDHRELVDEIGDGSAGVRGSSEKEST